MPFIPHTETDIREMLAAIGAPSIDALFDEIPSALISRRLDGVPEGLAEMEIARLMQKRAAQDGQPLCFIGAGAYDHHIPAAVWQIVSRGEFYSAYTPYQAEASQGTLQLIYEYQSMMTGLTGMDVSNASLYDGASGLAEAVLMAVRANRQSESARVLLPSTVHPFYRQTARNIVNPQGIQLDELPYCTERGTTLVESLKRFEGQDITALVIPQPNFFGCLEDVDALTDWAHANKTLVIAVVNPLSLGLLKPPGQWGTLNGTGGGADIVCGDGQPFGSPLASGGPYFGFLCCKQALVRQMPGRIVGRTVDLDGKPGFTLTLQAREQHIRRAKATSNICTNQGLLVTAATIHMALLGPAGLQRVAAACHANTQALIRTLTAIKGVQTLFSAPLFHEAVLRLDRPVVPVLEALADRGILGGFDLSRHYPELGNALLVCATETRTAEDIEDYAIALKEIMTK
ncbi:MAG: aminomethyl-transferring glycine dehydrogenase subunit GcvPA, partial [Nevskiales bacterium]